MTGRKRTKIVASLFLGNGGSPNLNSSSPCLSSLRFLLGDRWVASHDPSPPPTPVSENRGFFRCFMADHQFPVISLPGKIIRPFFGTSVSPPTASIKNSHRFAIKWHAPFFLCVLWILKMPPPVHLLFS